MTAPPTIARSGRVLPSPVSGQEVVLLVVVAVVWLLLALFTPAFLSPESLQPMLSNVAPIALVGIGMTFVIIAGGIDVSVAGMIMVCAVVVAKAMTVLAAPLPLALALAIALGGVLGLLNGVLTSFGRVHPIIITFGTANLFLFLGLRVFDSQVVNDLPDTLALLGRGEEGRPLGLPTSFLIMIVLAALAWWYLRYTAGGRHYYAIGGDPAAARLAGVRVQRRTALAYLITGLLVGLAACVAIANGTQTLAPTVGTGMELKVIAAVVIGGTSITGGRGTVLGTVLGAILVQSVTSGVTQLGWPSQLSELFVGVFIIIAVGADLLRRRLRGES
ncbi:ABC transporter permease [Microlunatus sp. GCM10028923]|uniref:ABC transporter permease n=1 Tax=Microlunatus sp. GCM10028923 TaxID=3273400 RepID=UPI00360B2ECC